MNSWQKFSGSLWRGTLDAVLPPRCFSCGILAAAQGDMCPQCWTGLSFISKPQCQCCGFPFEFSSASASAVEGGGEQLCGACMEKPPPFEKSRAVFRYDDASKRLILGLKYFDKLDGVEPFAKLMWRTIEPFTNSDSIIIPIPLHKRRLFHRRFNQSALLVRAMSKYSGLEMDLLSVVRKKSTISQGGLSRKLRAENVRGAFAIAKNTGNKLKGRFVVLVDDVHTTGATVNECVRVLLKHGVKSVVVVSLARVVSGH